MGNGDLGCCGEMVKGKNGWKLEPLFIFENQRWSELGREAVYKAPRSWFRSARR